MNGSRLPGIAKVTAKVMASAIATVLAAMLIAPDPSYAQQPPPAAAELQREIDRLQQQLNQLESLQQKVQVLDKQVQTQQQQQQVQQQADDKKFSELPSVSVGPQGLAVESPDKAFTLRIHGIIQADG